MLELRPCESHWTHDHLSASPDQLDRDLAGALAATAVAAGAERAAASAARSLDPAVLGGALRHLHKPALDPALGRSLRGNRALLADVRDRAARAASIDVPKLVEPRRVSWPTLIMIIGTLIGGWALIGVLIDVSRSFDTVIGADWLWVVMALVLAQLAYVASAATLVLFGVSLPFAWGSIQIEVTPESGGNSKLVWIILAIVVLVAVVAGLALAVPRLRRMAASKVLPKVRDIWGNLKTVASTPRKLVLLLGGSFAGELLVAMALSVSLRAFGDHLRLPTLIVVITLAAIVGGVAPSPGGIGVVEAGMILGLTAAGVSEADATAAVFIQRLFTSYLPPIWGWATLVWMRKREYL